jgi:CRP-like cAMP-binding protein
LALDDTITLLRGAPFIGLFEPEALRLLAFSAETRRLRAGEILFRRGERSDGGYVVTRGVIGMAVRAEEPELLVGPGSLIGQMALLVRLERPATATAREPAEILRISPTLIRRVLAEFPDAAAVLRDAMAADLGALSADLVQVGEKLLAIGRR